MATCKACEDPLVLTLEPEGDGQQEETVPDDLLLPCLCHFHWQCLLDQSPEVLSTLKCPSCGTYLPTSSSSGSSSSAEQGLKIPTLYTNEGGPQPELDILPLIREEAYLGAHPEARPARAMHTMASEGDASGIISLLADIENDSDIDMTTAQLLPWSDPLNDGKSAIHVAIESGQEEVFWMLLWLGSNVSSNVFPSAVIQAAGAMGLTRRDHVSEGEDVRFVRDEQGRTAKEVCAQMGKAPWTGFAEGVLFNYQ